jgi:hypothetical protein
MKPAHTGRQVVMACHITGHYDVNRSQTLPGDDFSLVQDWADSIAALGIEGILFHNNLSERTCQTYANTYLTFIRISHDPRFNPNVYRYLLYRGYLRTHAQEIESLFVTDVSDVVVVNNPFVQPLFRANPGTVFCGDEPICLDNDWMRAHATHLRQNIGDYAHYEAAFAAAPLLNCGIIGGDIQVMQELMEALAHLHETYNHNNQTAYTGDMGAFNYLLRTRFADRLLHGPPVNTVFKGYEVDREDCWFRHK